MIAPPDPLTLTEAAAELGTGTANLRMQIRNGKLAGVKRGGLWWVTRAEVERYRAVVQEYRERQRKEQS